MGSLQKYSVIKGAQCDLKPQLLHRIFEKKVETRCGHKAAIIYHDENGIEQQINYKTLNSITNQYAASIIHLLKNKYESKSNQDGDWIVGVCMTPSKELIQVLLSIWKAGGAYLPIDPSFPQNRIEHILNEAKPVLIVHDNDIDGNKFINVPSISINNLTKVSSDFMDNNINSENTLSMICGGGGKNDIGIVLYTSGSTGVPKGKSIKNEIICENDYLLF